MKCICSTMLYFFCNDTATTEIYTYGHTLSLHDALPISAASPTLSAGGFDTEIRFLRFRTTSLPISWYGPLVGNDVLSCVASTTEGLSCQRRSGNGSKLTRTARCGRCSGRVRRSEEHTTELQSLIRTTYAVVF